MAQLRLGAPSPSAAGPWHLQDVQADLISRRYPAGQHDDANALASHGTNEAYATYTHADPLRRVSARPG